MTGPNLRPVAPYPTRPPIGRCLCASCARHRVMAFKQAFLPVLAAAVAYANAMLVAARVCEDTPAAKVEKAAALVGVFCAVPTAVSESLASVARQHRLARDVWADRQRGILNGESVLDPKGVRDVGEMLRRFKAGDNGGQAGPVVVIQARPVTGPSDLVLTDRSARFIDRKRADDA